MSAPVSGVFECPSGAKHLVDRFSLAYGPRRTAIWPLGGGNPIIGYITAIDGYLGVPMSITVDDSVVIPWSSIWKIEDESA